MSALKQGYLYKVHSLDMLTDTVMKITLSAEDTPMVFQAGQYLEVDLGDDGRRPFSIANAPLAQHIELHVRHHKDNDFVNTMLEEIKQQGILKLFGPYGHCLLSTEDVPSYFIAQGTGFAPMKALIEQALYQHHKSPMYLCWLAKSRSDLYQELLPQSWSFHIPHFHFGSFICAEAGILLPDGLLQAFKMPEASANFYAAGNSDVVQTLFTYLQRKGITQEHFFSDTELS